MAEVVNGTLSFTGRRHGPREPKEGEANRRALDVDEALPRQLGDDTARRRRVADEVRLNEPERDDHMPLGVTEEHREKLHAVVHVGDLKPSLNYGLVFGRPFRGRVRRRYAPVIMIFSPE
jgi:hypothetical protein